MTKANQKTQPPSSSSVSGFFFVHLCVVFSEIILQQFYTLMGLIDLVSPGQKNNNTHDRYEQKEQSSKRRNQKSRAAATSDSLQPTTPSVKLSNDNSAPGAPLKPKRSRLEHYEEDEDDELEYRLTGYRRGEREGASMTPVGTPLRAART